MENSLNKTITEIASDEDKKVKGLQVGTQCPS